jgi:hypothetical protein
MASLQLIKQARDLTLLWAKAHKSVGASAHNLFLKLARLLFMLTTSIVAILAFSHQLYRFLLDTRIVEGHTAQSSPLAENLSCSTER